MRSVVILPPAMESPLNGIFQQSFFQRTDSIHWNKKSSIGMIVSYLKNYGVGYRLIRNCRGWNW